jgi:hypothetical protein
MLIRARHGICFDLTTTGGITLRRLRGKLTYANVMVTLLLFVVLGGGAYAASALPANSVGTLQIKKRAVTLSKIAPGAQKALRGQAGAAGPTGPQGPTGPEGAARATGALVPAGTAAAVTGSKATATATDTLGVIATLPLPAGDWVVFAKAWAEDQTAGFSTRLDCSLGAGSEVDTVVARLQDPTVTGSAFRSTLAFNVPARLSTAGQAVLECQAGGGSSVTINDIRISAIEVGSLSTSALG